MRIGFTGTRKGMNRLQARSLQLVLAWLGRAPLPSLHYGTHESVELKADKEASELAKALGFNLMPYPARKGSELERDKKIVRDVSILIAAPLTDKEEQRSGTWATVRYARQKGIPIVMLSRGES